MKPAEIVTVVVSIPLVAALLVAEAAESRTPAPSRPAVVETAQAEAPAPTFFGEIVVTAKRVADRG